jgi:hypothetical protein
MKIGGRKFTSLWLVYPPVFVEGLPAIVFGWFTSHWQGQRTIAPEAHKRFAKVSKEK